LPKKNALPRESRPGMTSGPPKREPNWFWSSSGFSFCCRLLNQVFALSRSFR
jgi:hypothetical protein